MARAFDQVDMGPLTAGEYRLELNLQTDAEVSLRLVVETFNTVVVEDCYDAGQKRLTIPFTIWEWGNHYVQAYPRRPVRITRLAVVPTGQQSR